MTFKQDLINKQKEKLDKFKNNANLIYQRLQKDKIFKRELYRKAIHLSSLWIPLAIFYIPYFLLLPLFMVILIGNIVLEYGNFKRQPWARKSFGMLFLKTFRKKETSHEHFQFTGSIYVFSSAIVCIGLFSKEIASMAMTVMLLSDCTAALVGRSIGKVKIFKQKTLEGSLAFFISALMISALFIPVYPFGVNTLIACFVATLAEVFEDKIGIDDNLSIPFFFAIAMVIF